MLLLVSCLVGVLVVWLVGWLLVVSCLFGVVSDRLVCLLAVLMDAFLPLLSQPVGTSLRGHHGHPGHSHTE